MSAITTGNIPSPTGYITAQNAFTSAGVGDWIQVTNTVLAEVSGSGIVEVSVERSATDPAGTATPTRVGLIHGDATAGISPAQFNEPYVGWWRIRVEQMVAGVTITTRLTGYTIS